MVDALINAGTKIVGAAVGIGTARKQKKESKKLQAQADKVVIQEEDPEILNLRNQVRERANRLNTGSINSINQRLINSAVSSTIDAATSSVSGGGADGTSALRALATKGGMIAGAQAANAQLEGQLLEKEAGLTEDIAQRKLEVRLLEKNTLEARANQLLQGSQANMQGAIAGLTNAGADIAQGVADKVAEKKKKKQTEQQG